MAARVISDVISKNGYSRPGYWLERVYFVYMHWVANPKTTAQQNRDFFEMRKDGQHGYGSGHYIVDKDEVIRCIPESEIALSVGTGNGASRWASELLFADQPFVGRINGYSSSNYFGVAVEMCHEDWEGSFHPQTWENAVELVADICESYALVPHQAIITHNMVVDWKDCPRWFVKYPSELERFKDDVLSAMGGQE